MDVSGIGGTWNGGEEITVTLDDGDLNLNSLVDEDFSLTNWAQRIPTVITGSPLTLEDATDIMIGGIQYSYLMQSVEDTVLIRSLKEHQ